MLLDSGLFSDKGIFGSCFVFLLSETEKPFFSLARWHIDAEFESKRVERSRRKRFGEDVRDLKSVWYVSDPEIPQGNLLPYIVPVCLEVFAAFMERWICCQVNCREIVAEQLRWTVKRNLKFLQYFADPGCFCDCQDITLVPRKVQKPPVDRRVEPQPA
ncbi:uncharacterized protein LOC110230447 isoform X2 [Arabidopsis lyrata subsp. lyrata]|uniref:uncharacterized protein LOC110230447 isoform X2 n=1 Tax=Arabidopsis lyrata subsp. lyrata TaxID=81972 RepID=UPI000A29A97D|nr:uncharacterized protein LOC110230447 isoform X2 [Arabidopsis lyrata subsp. lyrata]|eukprot:XP_020889056.1 uncharacterized protein LOC110230447 isoform X2 [Arabidopsis lyrata subsp. lyrata]